jgi:drug/metabolite transporter (DMT)-like permease
MKTRGVQLLLLSTVLFTFSFSLIKTMDRIPVHELALFRTVCIFVFSIFAARVKNISIAGTHKKLLVSRGIFGTLAMLSYFYTLKHMPLATALTIQYLAPIFAIGFASVLLKEHTHIRLWVCFLVSLVGVWCVKGFDPRVSLSILLLGLLSASGSGMAYTIIRALKSREHHLTILFYFSCVTLPVAAGLCIWHWVPPTFNEWMLLILFGISTTAAQVCMTRAYQAEELGKIGNLNYLGVVYSLAIGYYFFNESMPAGSLLGMGIIILSAWLSHRLQRNIKVVALN